MKVETERYFHKTLGVNNNKLKRFRFYQLDIRVFCLVMS